MDEKRFLIDSKSIDLINYIALLKNIQLLTIKYNKIYFISFINIYEHVKSAS